MRTELTPSHLLAAYAGGIFPMADDDRNIFWFAPDPRALIELESFHVSRSLRSLVRRGVFELRIDYAFHEVIEACARRKEGTWISAEIVEAYRALHRLGYAHSVESWQDEKLAGGLYGVAMGGAFFGESMFYRVTDASKVALVHLVERMRSQGFSLLDVQFMTDHLRRFGAVEIPKQQYLKRLRDALERSCEWGRHAPRVSRRSLLKNPGKP